MMFRILAACLLLASTEALRGSPSAKKSVAAVANAVPAWACDIKAVDSVHQVFATGNANLDKEDGVAIDKIAKLREASDEKMEESQLKFAKLETEKAGKELELSKALSDQAKAEAAKDSKKAAADARASSKAVDEGQKAIVDANKVEAKAKDEMVKGKKATESWESDAKFLKASATVEAAAKLLVPAADSAMVTKLMEEKKKDLLVAFYAPWCPHCQTYVMHDEHGIPEKAPFELLAKEFQQVGAAKTLSLLKFDTQASPLPAGFDVQYIPTMYLVTAEGKKTPFKGDPHDVTALKAFIKAQAPRTTGI